MSASVAFTVLVGYFGVLLLLAYLTRSNSSSGFFTANRAAPWYVVAFGMIGASLSGVTFISVPGWVATTKFGYLQMVLGYILGYVAIAYVLLPAYYRLGVVSIYQYLEVRFGQEAYRVGAGFFLLSRMVGASFRLLLVAQVLQLFLFDALGVPFWGTTLVAIALIWLYTQSGGLKTIIWTDMLQTFAMLAAVCLTLYFLSDKLGLSVFQAFDAVWEGPNSQIIFWEGKQHFLTHFLSGALITLTMTGLDQDMMQKNLACRNLQESQKNILSLSVALVPVNLLFLFLGGLLYFYAAQTGFTLPEKSDMLFPEIAKSELGLVGGIIFLLGITAAAYSSADSALTSLTTSFCVDFLGFENSKKQWAEEKKRTQRRKVHLAFSGILFLLIVLAKALLDTNVINGLFQAASYTYGPLLGLFAVGLYSKIRVKKNAIVVVCLLAPFLSYGTRLLAESWGYTFGYEILLVNAGYTALGIWAFKQK